MPAFTSRRLIALLLVLALGHAPIPWVHHHEWLDEEQLQAHLESSHAGDEGGLPLAWNGWHLHVFCIGLHYGVPQDGLAGTDSTSDGLVFCDQQPQTLVQSPDAPHRRPRRSPAQRLLGDANGLRTLDRFAAPSGIPRSHASRHVRSDARLYELFCSLLI